MKIGIVTKPNEKGQIVIPKEMRDALGVGPETQLHITARGRGIYIYPIQDIIPFTEDAHSSYVNILKKTRGKWASEKWGETREARKKTELKASRSRKKAW